MLYLASSRDRTKAAVGKTATVATAQSRARLELKLRSFIMLGFTSRRYKLHNYDIYGLGAALVDTEIEVNDDDLARFGITKGVMTLVDEQRQHELLNLLADHLCQSKRASGGSAANTVIAAQYLGAKTFYSCKVADDENGRFYLNDLSEAGVEFPSAACAGEGITGKCLVMITGDAERTMNTFLGISETLSVEQIDKAAVKRSKYVYVEGYLATSTTGKPAAIALLEQARAGNVKTALSLSDPAIVKFFHADLQEIIGTGVDLLFCNEAEALAYTQSTTLEQAQAALQGVAGGYAITRGALGAVIFDGKTTVEVPAPKVQAVDSNGAGDMFAGAFLAAISGGASYQLAAEKAVKAASKVVSQYGPRLAAAQYADLT